MGKGQTEDIFADLIPAIIILIIAAFFLSMLSEKQANEVENRILEFQMKDAHNDDFALLLRTPIDQILPSEIVEEFQKRGDDIRQLTLTDTIRLSALKKEKYPLLKMASLKDHLAIPSFKSTESDWLITPTDVAPRQASLVFLGDAASDWDLYVIFVPIAQAMALLGVEKVFVEIHYADGAIKKIGDEIKNPEISFQSLIPDYNGGEIKLTIKGR